ncbi:MAG: outer membrane protein beta-barrel protein [Xanthobacteraceae bacterium]|nr:outer membrane protein beta-barrel protein [Xanthobacteraceae bacterium]
MNRIWMIALAACAGIDAGTAQAAPLADRAYNWTGIYTGVHAGYGVGNTDWPTVAIPTDGALGGVQLGYNQQIGNLLFGIEGDFTFSGISGDRKLTMLSLGTLTQTSKVNWLSTATGRIGFVGGSWLTYAKAGAAWVNENHGFETTTPAGNTSLAGRENRTGWIVGAGAEYALADKWSVRAEYNFINFAHSVFAINGTTPAGALDSSGETTQTLHLVKLGVNYQFGAPAAATTVAPVQFVPTSFDWSGAYVGAQAGYGRSVTTVRDFDPDGQFTGAGGFAGGQIGANAQLGIVVFGVEAELVGGDLGGSANFVSPLLVNTNLASRTDWLAMATARFGILTNERWLSYVKAGVAAAHERHANALVQGPDTLDVAGSRIHTGLVVGFGVEYGFARNWSAKLEYDHINFGSETATVEGELNSSGASGHVYAGRQIEQSVQLGKIGVNYHFAP